MAWPFQPRRGPRPRTASGYPKGIYVTPTRIAAIEGIPADVLSVFLPPNGNTLILNGETRTVRNDITMEVHHISVDIPAGMTAELLLDGALVHESTDGKGQAGGIPISLPGLQARKARTAAATLTNNSGEDLNAKYIITGVPI